MSMLLCIGFCFWAGCLASQYNTIHNKAKDRIRSGIFIFESIALLDMVIDLWLGLFFFFFCFQKALSNT